ncbi:MAG: redoxin family protein [Mycoplasmatales bacterium]|nr:redoxin family protein [Mycoplasmatales bacterium]
MNKVTLHNEPFELSGMTIEENTKLDFKAEDANGIWDIKDIKGKKVISLFPDINTGICDVQTQLIANLAKRRTDITFISISTDSVEIQKEWCASKGLENVLIVSDDKYKEFQKLTNLYIPKIDKLIRGFILLDEENIIRGITLNSELAEDPDYASVDEWIK